MNVIYDAQTETMLLIGQRAAEMQENNVARDVYSHIENKQSFALQGGWKWEYKSSVYKDKYVEIDGQHGVTMYEYKELGE